MKILLVFLFGLFSFSLPAQVWKKLDQLNSPFRETNLSITPNGKYLYFLSDRGGQPWSEKRRNAWSVGKDNPSGPGFSYDGDIWYSRRENGSWSEPVCLGPAINTSYGEDEPNISADGQRVYFQSWRRGWERNGGPYYLARLNGTRWERPEGLGGAITRFFLDMDDIAQAEMIKDLREARILEEILLLQRMGQSKSAERLLKYKGIDMNDYAVGTDGMAVSPDERSMVLSVYDPERKGFDLYLSKKEQGGDWSYPRPLNLNSPQDEISAFIAADNRTLYFASDRPGGFGGFDIYKATIGADGRCSKPVNLGAKYNKSKDEYAFIIDMLAGDAFLVSDGDIYQIELEEAAQPEESIVLNGRVVDSEGNALASNVYLLNTRTADTLSISTSNSRSGEFGFSFLRRNGSYRLLARSPQGRSGKVDFQVGFPTGKVLEYTIVIPRPDPPQAKIAARAPEPPAVSAPLPKSPPPADLKTEAEGVLSQPTARGSDKNVFVINNIRFDSDRSSLSSSSFETLDRLAEILKARPGSRFEIGGHTNILPPEDYCLELSTERARAVYDYLKGKGVPAAQLTYKGYGKSRPLETDPDVELQKVNQRVEIRVLGEE